MTARDKPHTRDLAQQLAEANATIAALLSGQIDAVVDAESATPVLLTKALKALRESEARFREQAALLDIAHDAIYVRDLDGRITYWNKGAERAYGWTAEEAVGRRAVELLCKEPSAYLAAEAELLVNGAWHGEMARRTNADRDITMAVRWTLVRDAHGDPTSILAINTDITAQKLAVEALAELSRRTDRRERILTNTLSSISDFAYIYDRDGRFLFVNQPLLDLWGLTLEAAVGKNFFDLGYPHDLAAQLQRQVQEVFETKTGLTGETRYTSPTGVDGCYEYIFSPAFGPDGTVEFVAGTTRDITDRKRIEAELRAAKDTADAANQAKSEFLANMSHEIRTPMNGVIGMTVLLLDSDLTSEQRENLGMIKSSGDALMGVINDILDFSKIEAGKLELDPIDFTARVAIADAANAVALKAREKGLDLIVNIDGAVPPTLRGDPGRLRQILLNLLGNAIKFTDQGEVVLSVTSAATAQGEVVLSFSIRDTGVGIPMDRQQSIFEAFTQVDGSTTRKYGGTGLGLTISSKLVQLMGGRISVESEAGKGSTFLFDARFGVGRRQPLVTRHSLRESRRTERILLVEDNAVNQLVARRLLEKRGHTVVAATNGREALAVLEASAWIGFDCVLMDIQMPEMDGFECTAIIRSKESVTRVHLPIVAMTAHAMTGDEARCLAAGMDAYLSKPIDPNALFDVIDQQRLVSGAGPSDALTDDSVVRPA